MRQGLVKWLEKTKKNKEGKTCWSDIDTMKWTNKKQLRFAIFSGVWMLYVMPLRRRWAWGYCFRGSVYAVLQGSIHIQKCKYEWRCRLFMYKFHLYDFIKFCVSSNQDVLKSEYIDTRGPWTLPDARHLLAMNTALRLLDFWNGAKQI